MSSSEAVDDLVSVQEIAEFAGVGSSAVSNWINRHVGFPPPVIDKGHHKLYARREVERWLEVRGQVMGYETYCLDCGRIYTDADYQGSRATGHRTVVVKLEVV